MMRETGSILTENLLTKIIDDPSKENSPAGRAGRRKVMLRAIYGEFVGTTIFFTPIFGANANSVFLGWDQSFTNMTVALVSGLHVTAAIMCFSGISGAQFNPAVSFALWLTNKLSNRKFLFYVIAQMSASVFAMFLVYCSFSHGTREMFEACAVQPKNDAEIVKVFITEFVCTFIMTYVAFTAAFEEAESMKKSTMSVQAINDSDGLTLYSANPQSKAGFAPFAIGFTVFSMSMFGGSSGVSMNPVRMFGPALFSGVWDYFYVYWLAEFAGAGAAALIVVYGIQSVSHEEIFSRARRNTTLATSTSLRGDGSDVRENVSLESGGVVYAAGRNPLQNDLKNKDITNATM